MEDDPKPKVANSVRDKKSKGVAPVPQTVNINRGPEYAAASKERIVRDTVTAVTTKKTAPASPIHSKPKPTASSVPDDDEYGDDFEEYADEFENEEDATPTPAPFKASAPAPSPAPVPIVTPAPEKQPTSSLQHERQSKGSKASRPAPDLDNMTKPLPDADVKQPAPKQSSLGSGSSSSSGGGRRTKKFEAVSMALDASAFGRGPRARRLQRLYDSGVLDMQEEKFTLLSIPSSTPMDVYQRLLRPTQMGATPSVRQFGVPAEDERRSIEVATEDLHQADKNIQFCYGDDTELLAVLNVLQRKQQAAKSGVRLTKDEAAEMSAVLRGGSSSSSRSLAQKAKEKNDDDDNNGNGGMTRLGNFLQKASLVCERLLEEDLTRKGKQPHIDRSSMHNSVFNSGSNWAELGASVHGSNELIRTRSVAALQFSVLQPNLLCTAHPYPVLGDEEDLLPLKGIYCVWDVTSPGEPAYVMAATGQPTSCTFSATQTFLIVGGTSEGTLHLWDMRESSSMHRNSDAVDLGIERGIRKPCYSSPLSSHGLTANTNTPARLSEIQHTSPIVQIASIGDVDPSPSAVSQFASLDQQGMIGLWLSAQQGAASDGDGLSAWGKVRLVLARALQAYPKAHPTADAGLWDLTFQQAIGNVGATSVFATVPGDVSTFLTAGARGSVCKVVRFGTAPAPDSLERSVGESIEVAFQSRPTYGLKAQAGLHKGSTELQMYAEVTCISVQRQIVRSNMNTENRREDKEVTSIVDENVQLVLVGRSDGTVDLFRMDVSSPLQTWVLDSALSPQTRGKSSASSKGPIAKSAIACVQWLPNKLSSFLVINASGESYVYDLLLDSNIPLCVEKLPVSPSGVVCDMSKCRNRSNPSAYFAMGSRASGGRVQVRAVWEGWLRSSPQDGSRLLEQMPQWTLRTTAEKGRLHMVDPLLQRENSENAQRK